MKKPCVDPDLCTGCATCVELCPDVFELNESEIAVVKNPKGAAVDEIQEAIDNCPTEAISWTSD
ncbi:MAG: ferredoxin [bacterium]